VAGGEYAVKVNGLAELRRDLRRLQPALATQLSRVLKEAASIVAADAASLAPRKTGALAASYRPYASGNRAGVRSRLPYAAVHEYGGTISPRGADILIARSEPVSRAVARNTDAIMRELEDGFEVAAARTGWTGSAPLGPVSTPSPVDGDAVTRLLQSRGVTSETHYVDTLGRVRQRGK
jgi:phage gpG-like protein